MSDADWDGIEQFREEARALAEEPFLRAEQFAAERDVARNRVAALEKNGAELLARAEAAERELTSLTESRVFWRKFAAKLEAERDERQDERDNYEDRLRKVESAYSRLDAQKRDLEGVRDRLRVRAEQAEHELADTQRTLAEEITAIGEERIATRRADVLEVIRERDAFKSATERVERLRDKWLTWPKDDMHYAAGLMLDRHLSGEAFTSDTRPVSVESPGNDGFRYERAVDPQQRFMTPRERLADDVGLQLLKTADDFADGDLIVGNLYALRDAVMGEVLPVLEQLESAIERARRMAQVWVDIRPVRPTVTREGHAIAHAGQQILDALKAPGSES